MTTTPPNITPSQNISLSFTPVSQADLPAPSPILKRIEHHDIPTTFPLLDTTNPSLPPPPIPYLDREAITTILQKYNASISNPILPATLAALRADAHFIIAGQQPGLMLGPLYTFLKAVTAITLAKHLTSILDTPIIPAFWIASEDHDLLEVNRCTINSKTFISQHPHRPSSQTSVAATSLKDTRTSLIDFLDTTLASAPFKSDVIDAVSRADFSNYASFFATLFAQLFSPGQIIFIDPATLRQPAAPVIATILKNYPQLIDAFDQSPAALQSQNFTPQLDKLNLFEIINHNRTPVTLKNDLIHLADRSLTPNLAADFALNHPARFSPGAALRPIIQDAILPTLATIAGPSELLYLWQINPLYSALNITCSRLSPRISATFIDDSVARQATCFSLKPQTIFKAVDMLQTYSPAAYFSDDSQSTSSPSDTDLTQIGSTHAALIDQLTALNDDRNAKQIDKAKQSITHQINKLTTRIRDQRLAALHLSKADLQQLVDAIYPKNKPQERTHNLYQYLAKLGPSFITQLITNADPLNHSHQLIHISQTQNGAST